MASATLRHQVRDALQKRIAARVYAPGHKLKQTQLAAEFDVAVSVVREALIELHAYGLVEAIDNRGAIVREMSNDELLESLELREIFEGYVARRCCSRVTVQQLRDLRQLATRIYREYQQGSRVDAARLDQEFHARLVAIANNRGLTRLAGTYWPLGKVATVEGGDWEEAYDGHLRILDAIASGDEDAAERVMRQQVRRAREQFVQLLNQPGLTITWLGSPESYLTSPSGSEKTGRGIDTSTQREKMP